MNTYVLIVYKYKVTRVDTSRKNTFDASVTM